MVSMLKHISYSIQCSVCLEEVWILQYFNDSLLRWCVEFTNSSKNLAKIFWNLLKSCYGQAEFYDEYLRGIFTVCDWNIALFDLKSKSNDKYLAWMMWNLWKSCCGQVKIYVENFKCLKWNLGLYVIWNLKTVAESWLWWLEVLKSKEQAESLKCNSACLVFSWNRKSLE